MEKEQIKEGNKLIAEFDGFNYINDAPGIYPNGYYIHTDISTSFKLTEDMEYHESWDWLMPVVEKIGQLYNDKHLHEQPICKRTIFSTIDEVYKAVIQFIQWYNSITK